MRIIGGEFRGRRLRAPKGLATRPTADRVKEAVFNILGPPPPGTRALDLYAGSGALGLEAVSRGCESAVLVERAAPALQVVRGNISDLQLGARTRVVEWDVFRAIDRLAKDGERFGWIFLDPPYAHGELERVLAAVARVCAEGVIVLAEHDVRHVPPETCGALRRTDQRRYGDTCVSFYQPSGDGETHE